jgi:hypothetical protein
VLRAFPGGARSRLWLVGRPDGLWLARAVTAGEPSLRWQDQVQAMTQRCGIAVARMRPTASGAFAAGGIVLEPFLDSLPGRAEDLTALAPRLRRWHAATRGTGPRPGLAAAAAAAARLPPGLARRCRMALPQGPRTAVHGDLHPGNLLRLPGGGLALVDWEEARRDAAAVDEVALRGGLAGGRRAAALAPEVVACWQAEPARARALARRL